MAFLTLSEVMRPLRARLLIREALVLPEEIQAIVVGYAGESFYSMIF